jgi:hypothetical protein
VVIAQVKRELSVVGEALVGMTFINLESHSIGVVQETRVSNSTSSQYKAVRPSITDWDRTIRCSRISS